MTEHPLAIGVDAARLPLDALCDHLVAGPHARMHAAVPRIRSRLAALAAREPEGPATGLQAAFADLATRLLAHLAKVENILFPAVTALADAERSGRSRPALAFPTVVHPIRVLEAEHERLLAALAEVEALRGELSHAPPDDAWHTIQDDLTAFHADLAAHVHFEAEVLFPRAIELDQRL